MHAGSRPFPTRCLKGRKVNISPILQTRGTLIWLSGDIYRHTPGNNLPANLKRVMTDTFKQALPRQSSQYDVFSSYVFIIYIYYYATNSISPGITGFLMVGVMGPQAGVPSPSSKSRHSTCSCSCMQLGLPTMMGDPWRP